MSIRQTAVASMLLCVALLAHTHAVRAETFNTCAGFIDTLPTTITTQGVWCLKKDLATNVSSGAAITIAANNVTIDCNDFKIGGLAAGDASTASGIATPIDATTGNTTDVQNVTIRHCSVRGFNQGIAIYGGYGHLIEDNRLDNNLKAGIWLSQPQQTPDDGAVRGLIRRNRVLDTGGFANASAVGIRSNADIEDNVVDGVLATSPENGNGIVGFGSGSEISGNVVRNISGGASNSGIHGRGLKTRIHDNHVYAVNATGTGIYADNASSGLCGDNLVSGFSTAYGACADGGNNLSL